MTWSKHRRRRTYHHGNLREALIDAALELIASKGPTGFTVAEAARAAGVSPAAPYRHFRDRDALMADVAKRGFVRFEADLSAAWDGGQPSPMRALENLAKAYLAFARNEPAYYSAMFEAGIPVGGDPDLSGASEGAFVVLREACEAVSATLPAKQRPPVMMMALHVWSMTHGIASLFGRGDDARRPLPMPPEELLEAAILIYLQGLGINEGTTDTDR